MSDPKVHQPQIVLVAGIIVMSVTLLAGVAVFVVTQRQAEEFLNKSLTSSLQNRVQLAELEIRAGFGRAMVAATRPLLIDQVGGVRSMPCMPAGRSFLIDKKGKNKITACEER